MERDGEFEKERREVMWKDWKRVEENVEEKTLLRERRMKAEKKIEIENVVLAGLYIESYRLWKLVFSSSQ